MNKLPAPKLCFSPLCKFLLAITVTDRGTIVGLLKGQGIQFQLDMREARLQCSENVVSYRALAITKYHICTNPQ